MSEILDRQSKIHDSKHDSDSEKALPKLQPPSKDHQINVAFVMTEGATMIDFAGPWEVFQDVATKDHNDPFHLYTVSDEKKLIRASGGLKIMPDYTFKDAPTPQIIVVPAQSGRSEAMMDWLRKISPTTDVTMSVCTGAYVLAKAGLLDGLRATTHHTSLDDFAKRYPGISVDRQARFVENKRISTAAGLTSGIDLALRVVERYFGRDVAVKVADYMEYRGKSWIMPDMATR